MGNDCQERSTGTDCHPWAKGKKASRAAVPALGFLPRDGWAGLARRLINIDECHSLVSAWITMVASAGHRLNGLAWVVTVRRNGRCAPVHDHFLPIINVEEPKISSDYNTFNQPLRRSPMPANITTLRINVSQSLVHTECHWHNKTES